MAKSKTKKVVKVKKVRTPEEKAARKDRRKAKRASQKVVSELKNRISDSKTNKSIADITSVPVAIVTTDGLPFSKSVDNPDSLLGMMAAADADKKIITISDDVKALAKFRTKKFAPMAKEHIILFENM